MMHNFCPVDMACQAGSLDVLHSIGEALVSIIYYS